MESGSLERLYLRQPFFSFILAGNLEQRHVAAGVSLLEGHLAGTSVRELVPGRSARVCVTHEPDFPAEDFAARLRALAEEHALSYALFPGEVEPPEYKVLVMDMDSTLIGQEVIEELADFAGVREEVARVTAEAMEGRLDFAGALRERVRHLAGQPAEILETVRRDRVRANPGAAELLAELRGRGVLTAVVSGGFEPITVPFTRDLAIEHAVANTLEIKDGRLTGRVTGEIVDSAVKRRTLLELCQQAGCGPHEAVAVGDGANDLEMLGAAGLGVAFCAKPVVRRATRAAVNRPRLDDVLLLMG